MNDAQKDRINAKYRMASEMTAWLLKSDDYPCDLWEMRSWLDSRGYCFPRFPIPEPLPDEGSEEWNECFAALSRTLEEMIDCFPIAADWSNEDIWNRLSNELGTSMRDDYGPE